MGIYVETKIQGSIDELWRLTQTPDEHVRWDLRFTDIEYLPRATQAEPQRFSYATRIGFGLAIQGHGETTGERDGANGERTSALKFWSDDSKSLIREGSGYWRYIPTEDGVRFFTWYDYQVRFGMLGRLFDRWIFRPLMGWATAWSFDRLRLWIERGIEPSMALRNGVIHGIARVMIALVWLYHGIVPKLVYYHADEVLLTLESGVSLANVPHVLRWVGLAEVGLGLAVLACFPQRWPLWLTIVLMLGALTNVAISAPHYLVAAFNPVSLNALMIALSVVGLLSQRDLPSARRCLREPPRSNV